MKKVLILFGGKSTEHQISCNSAKSILENIDKNKYSVTAVGIDYENNWFKYKGEISKITGWQNQKKEEIDNIIKFVKGFDIVFPVLHGTYGEDGKLQGLLDLTEIKYVGCKTLSSAICMDKVISKYLFQSLNIPQVPFVELNEQYNLKNICKQLGYPVIVKPANGGSSIGINKANNIKELKKVIKEALKYDKKVLIEKFIHAKELECAVLIDKEILVSDIGEIKAANEFYDYNAKYENKKSETIIPADISYEVKEKIKEYAKKAFIAVNASSLSRIDFFYEEETNQIYLNEINTMPGFTEISMYPKLFMNEGYTYQELITALIENA